jgi:cytidine deaminase
MILIKLSYGKKKLLEIASKSVNKAHVLWGFKVGAAVLAEDGRVYEGCNVESWISGLGICAERNAINHAVLHGNRKVKEIAIVMEASSHRTPRPCGACLQYIYDFAWSPKTKVLMAKAENGKILSETVEIRTVEELLPFPYRR